MEQLDKAADLASQSGHQHVVQWLLKKGAKEPVISSKDAMPVSKRSAKQDL